VRRAKGSDAATIARALRIAFAEFEHLYTPAAFAATCPGSEEIEQPDHCGTPTFTMTKSLEDRPMPTTKSHFSLVAETAPPEPEIAHQHFISKLELETDPSDVHFDMERGANGFVVVDARSVEAYARLHVPGAINLPSRSINAESAAVLPKDKVVVTYCWGPGCNASTKAAARLSKLGFRVKELIGGIEYWEKEGYAVEGPQPPDEGLYG